MDPLQTVLRILCRYLNENELFYVFTGELALRMTGCADAVGTVELLVNLTPEERLRFQNFLEQEGFAAESRWRGPAVLRHRATGLGLAIRLAGSRADMAAIGRRVLTTLGYLTFFIPSCEDLVLNSLQDTGVPRETVDRLYRKWRNYLDMEYLISGARERGIYPEFVTMKKRAER